MAGSWLREMLKWDTMFQPYHGPDACDSSDSDTESEFSDCSDTADVSFLSQSCL